MCEQSAIKTESLAELTRFAEVLYYHSLVVCPESDALTSYSDKGTKSYVIYKRYVMYKRNVIFKRYVIYLQENEKRTPKKEL